MLLRQGVPKLYNSHADAFVGARAWKRPRNTYQTDNQNPLELVDWERGRKTCQTWTEKKNIHSLLSSSLFPQFCAGNPKSKKWKTNKFEAFIPRALGSVRANALNNPNWQQLYKQVLCQTTPNRRPQRRHFSGRYIDSRENVKLCSVVPRKRDQNFSIVASSFSGVYVRLIVEVCASNWWFFFQHLGILLFGNLRFLWLFVLVAVTWMDDAEDLCNIEGDGDGDGRNSSGVSSSTSGKGKTRDFTVWHIICSKHLIV